MSTTTAKVCVNAFLERISSKMHEDLDEIKDNSIAPETSEEEFPADESSVEESSVEGSLTEDSPIEASSVEVSSTEESSVEEEDDPWTKPFVKFFRPEHENRRPVKLTKIPFLLRHRFTKWLLDYLEESYIKFIQEALPVDSQIYTKEHGWRFPMNTNLGERHKKELHRVDLSEWRYAFDKLEGFYGDPPHPEIRTSMFGIEDRARRQEIREGASEVRHAAVHRQNLDVEDLEDALLLPELFGDYWTTKRLQDVYELVMTASQPLVSKDVIDSLDKTFQEAKFRDVVDYIDISSNTDLLASTQQTIESAIFNYTKCHHPEILAERKWQEPEQAEQAELQVWQAQFQWGPKAVQDGFLDPGKDLLINALRSGRSLRNLAQHREDVVVHRAIGHIQNAIKTLAILGDDRGALEVEIQTEIFYIGTSRGDVLTRLASVAGDDEIYPEDVFALRRQTRRRIAIANADREGSRVQPGEDDNSFEDLMTTNPSTMSDAYRLSIDEAGWRRQQEALERPGHAIPNGIPEMIVVSEAVDFDRRREMHANSMHPILKVLPIPESSLEWDDKEPWKADGWECMKWAFTPEKAPEKDTDIELDEYGCPILKVLPIPESSLKWYHKEPWKADGWECMRWVFSPKNPTVWNTDIELDEFGRPCMGAYAYAEEDSAESGKDDNYDTPDTSTCDDDEYNDEYNDVEDAGPSDKGWIGQKCGDEYQELGAATWELPLAIEDNSWEDKVVEPLTSMQGDKGSYVKVSSGEGCDGLDVEW